MRVDHLSTSINGGAAVAARRLHEGLLAAGVESRFWYCRPRSASLNSMGYGKMRWPAENVWPMPAIAGRLVSEARRLRLKSDLKRSLKGRPPGLELFTSPRVLPGTPWDTAGMGTGILHLHWVAKFIDYPTFFASIPDDFPIVWLLHDMNPMTGGCHYAGDCERFTDECSHCPQLGSRGDDDLSKRFFHIKRDAIRGKNLHVVAPSLWLTHEARRSTLLAEAKSFRTIPYGLDVDQFSPRDKGLARRELDLPQDAYVVAFGADLIDNRRKGAGEFLQALCHLPARCTVIGLVFGNGQLPSSPNLSAELRNIGFVDDPHRQSTIYSAADVVVVPSQQDNSPQTGMEAMACGTPVVGFNVGGIPDYVLPRKTGLLAKPGDPRDLSRQIAWLADHPQERQQMGRNARKLILRDFREETQAQRFIELYRSLIAEHRSTDREAA